MEKLYVLNLTDDERLWLEGVCESKASVLKRKRARLLLEVDEGATDEEAADAAGAGVKTAKRIRKQCVLEGIEAALERKKQVRPSRKRTLDGRAEAGLVRIACSKPPPGRNRWTINMLADKLVELEVVPAVSRTTVHRTLKKTKRNHGW